MLAHALSQAIRLLALLVVSTLTLGLPRLTNLDPVAAGRGILEGLFLLWMG